MYGLMLYFDVYYDDLLQEWERQCLQKSVLSRWKCWVMSRLMSK